MRFNVWSNSDSQWNTRLHFSTVYLPSLQIDTCVYLNKKIEFCGGTVRCHVYEMWSHGERVACGVITENTKVSIVKYSRMGLLLFVLSMRKLNQNRINYFPVHLSAIRFEQSMNIEIQNDQFGELHTKFPTRIFHTTL